MTRKLQEKDEDDEEEQEDTEMAGQGGDKRGLEDGNNRLPLQAYNFPLLLGHCKPPKAKRLP